MSTNDPQFIALHVYSHDGHYGIDRPVAVILRLDAALQERVAQALQLIQEGAFLSLSIPLGSEDVRWIRTIGYTAENGLAQVPGSHRDAAAWMPPDAAVVLPDPDLMNLDLDGEVADYRDDCLLYKSESEPMAGVSCLELTRFETAAAGVRTDSPIHFLVNGNTRNYKSETLLHAAKTVWGDLVQDAEPAAHRDRQAA